MLTPGTLLESRYEVLDHVGTGTFARVYRVRHVGLLSVHALKVLEEHYARDESVRARFLAEGRIQAQLRHPHLVAATDIVTTPVSALVMDFVEGPSLRAWQHAASTPGAPHRVPFGEALELLLPVLDAVGTAHAAGIVHRDLKPENVLVARDARGRIRPMVTDFGIAKIVAGSALTTGGSGRTEAGVRIGTLQYMSPEQVRGADEVGPQADIYAIGVMLYELLTGHLPFDSESEFDTMQDIVAGRYVAPGTLVPDLPAAVSTVLRRALAVRPEDRFPDCATFRRALLDAEELVDDRATDPGLAVVPGLPASGPALRLSAPPVPPPAPLHRDDPTPSTAHGFHPLASEPPAGTLIQPGPGGEPPEADWLDGPTTIEELPGRDEPGPGLFQEETVVEAVVGEAVVDDAPSIPPGKPSIPPVRAAPPVKPSIPPVKASIPPVKAPPPAKASIPPVKAAPPAPAVPPPAPSPPARAGGLRIAAVAIVGALVVSAIAFVAMGGLDGADAPGAAAPPNATATPIATATPNATATAAPAAPTTPAATGASTAAGAAAGAFAARYPMVPVGPLQFTMGAPPSEPGRWKDEVPHLVALTRPITMGVREVDQALWTEVMGANPSTHVGPDRPVEGVSWLDAIQFCNQLSTREGLDPAYVIAGADVTWRPDASGFRLPTEAEWEAAARAGSTDPFAGAPVAEEVAWFARTAEGTTHPVGGRKPNALGLYDMSGNVSEWAWDWYADYPAGGGVTTDPVGPDTGESRIHRGGSWDANERSQRVAYRRAALPGTRSASIGLRLVRPGVTPATPPGR